MVVVDIDLNPVRAMVVEAAGDYGFSGFWKAKPVLEGAPQYSAVENQS